MLSRITQIIVLVAITTGPLWAQRQQPAPFRDWTNHHALDRYRAPLRSWYDGSRDGYIVRNRPRDWNQDVPADPFSSLATPLFAQQVPCLQCGFLHDPGLDACPFCGAVISTGGNAPRPDATRAPRRGPGQYYYRGPHYRFTGPTYLDGPHPNLDTPYDY